MRNRSNNGIASARSRSALLWTALLLIGGASAAWETRGDRAVKLEQREASVAPGAATLPAAPSPIAPPAPVAPAPAGESALMSPTLEAAFDAWLIETYKQCWSPPRATPDGDPYLPRVRVAFKADGALAAPPKLINPPSDPDWKAHAEAAVRAVKACDPIHVPEKYGPYYRQWKTKTVYFDSARP
jgi:hypothetical protein